MGTDIHMIAQVRDTCGCWEMVDIPQKDGQDWGNIMDGRNYNWFAVLGDVRNGTGFAGIRTSAGFKPISSGRGMPEDVGFEVDEDGYVLCPRHRPQPAAIEGPSTVVDVLPDGGTVVALVEDDDDEDDPDGRYECTECFWLGDHSHSWVSGKELVEYDWAGQQTALVGVIPLKRPDADKPTPWHDTFYMEWMKDEHFLDDMPPSYSGSVTGRNIVTLDEPQVREMLKSKVDRFDPATTYYVRLARRIGVQAAVGPVVGRTLDWIKSLDVDPADVRLVFGFDS